MAVPPLSMSLHASLAKALVRGGLWPATAEPPQLPIDDLAVGNLDLLPLLLQNLSSRGGLAGEVAGWLADQQGWGAALTLGYDSRCEAAARAWLGLRLVWWPRGRPTGRRIGLASSRLGRRLDRRPDRLAALRAGCARIDPRRDLLVTAADTAAAALVRRAAALFELPLLDIDTMQDDQRGWQPWQERIRQPPAQNHRLRQMILSPTLDGQPPSEIELAQAAPLRDRALVALSDRLLVFHLRQGGHHHRLLSHRLTSNRWPPGSVHVAVSGQPVCDPGTAQLLDAGAVGWLVPKTRHPQGGPPTGLPAGAEPAAVRSRPPDEGWDYLTHWTRRCDGPWPGQSEEQYLEELILQRPSADRSPLATLRQLIGTRKLLASPQAIRGGTAVVCFTAIPLGQLPQRRVFRPHRTRWDFEPYGICIRRQWLVQRGARPVQYGPAELWSALPEAERPFFQAQQSRTAPRAIDWTAEQEWRHIGDVPLDEVPSEAAFLFVPSHAEAAQLAKESPWPVVVLAAADQRPAAGSEKPGTSQDR